MASRAAEAYCAAAAPQVLDGLIERARLTVGQVGKNMLTNLLT